MPLNITITKRELKNKESGIDMSVNSYQSASTPKQVKNYHVVVITKLPFFKLPEHSENDVVQFMVPRDYDAFEKLQKEMTQDFPNLKLPTLPRKFHLFVNDTDIEERQVAFDCLVKVLARDNKKCVSGPLLEFLGFDLFADRSYFKRRKEFLQKQEEIRREKTEDAPSPDESGLFGEVGEANDDLFGDIPSTTSTAKPYTGGSIFDDGSSTHSGGPKRATKVSLLEDDDLFLTSDAQTTADANSKGEKSIFETEDNSDILDVSESLDDVLKIVNKPVKGKTAGVKKVTPGNSTSSGGGLFDVDDTTDSKGISSMDTDDITKYIQQNQTADDDFDLF